MKTNALAGALVSLQCIAQQRSLKTGRPLATLVASSVGLGSLIYGLASHKPPPFARQGARGGGATCIACLDYFIVLLYHADEGKCCLLWFNFEKLVSLRADFSRLTGAHFPISEVNYIETILSPENVPN